MQKKILNFQYSVHGSYYTALSYDVIHDVFVLFSFTKVEVIWFDTFVSDQSLLLLHVLLLLHINYRPNFWSQTKV